MEQFKKMGVSFDLSRCFLLWMKIVVKMLKKPLSNYLKEGPYIEPK